MILDIIYHYFLFKFFKYVKFSGHEDQQHILLSLKKLKEKYATKNGLLKEVNILGVKSKEYCLKSTAYYIKLAAYLKEDSNYLKDLTIALPSKIKSQNEVFNICQLYFSIKDRNGAQKLLDEISKLSKTHFQKTPISSIHIGLLKIRYDYHEGIINVEELEEQALDYIKDKTIPEIMRTNSFGNRPSTSHELGYLLNILLDIYEDINSIAILQELDKHIEKLHSKYVFHKTIFSTVIKRSDRVSLSGSFLISKVFLRYTLMNNDFRFANAAFFMLDTGKFLQKINRKKLLSNTFPVYRFGSPYKYPAWTLCYFVESLELKLKVKKQLEDEARFYV